MMNLDGKVVLVTGGSGLLGKTIIEDLKAYGATAINLDINIDTKLEEGTLQCDITDDKQVGSSVDAIVKYFGKIDGLVNNAYPRTKDWGTEFESINADSWRVNIDWQLNSYFVISQLVLKHMKLQRSGSVINIASIYGVVGNDMTLYKNTNVKPPAAYSAIKGGLVNFTRYLASLYGEFGVRINCVSPGGIFDNQDIKFVKSYEEKVPMKRMGTPKDIAPAVSFLVSDGAKYITGHNLVVDGGWTAI